MKKVIMCLFISACMCTFAACSNTGAEAPDASNKNDAQKEVVEYKEFADPRGKTLESTATGESNPKIVETLYETEDVVVADFVPTEMGYAVDPTGETDSTAGIQAALYDCYDAGGGTVYLPAGNYAISNTIHIPPHVTLRGDWQDPDVGTEYGTIISVWMEGDDIEGPGAFKLSGNAGAVGLTVYYPLQNLDCIVPYPYTFFVEENPVEYMLMTIKNVTIINGYRGIGTSYDILHEQLQLDNIKGTFLKYGINISNSSDVGTVNSIVINTKYWKEAAANCMNAVSSDAIDAYTKEYLTGMKIGDLEWTTFDNISIDNCLTGILIAKGMRIDFAGTFYDISITNCTKGIVFDGLDKRWGACIARSYIEGDVVNNTEGVVKLCDVEVEGDIISAQKNKIMVDEKTDLSAYEIDYDASYVKPASNIWIADLPIGLDTDASSELQALLNRAGEIGGVVYVPGGLYCFRSPITVPAGVELRGTASVPGRESDHNLDTTSMGTLFYCYYGVGATYSKDKQAFITLAGENAGFNGIRIMYPENSTKNNENFRCTTYTIRGTASGVYVVNSMIAASAYGVDFKDCDNHYIEGVMTTCYLNAFRVGGKNGVLTRCLQNGTVLQRTNQPGLKEWIIGSELVDYLFSLVTRQELDYIIVEDAEDQMIYNAFGYGIKTSVNNVNSKRTCAINIGADSIGWTVSQFVQNGGSMTGINILRNRGFSYELLAGELKLYNRHTINEAGERTYESSK